MAFGIHDAEHLEAAADEPGATPAAGQQMQGLGKRDRVPCHPHRRRVGPVLALPRDEQVQKVAELEQHPGQQDRRRARRSGPGRYSLSLSRAEA